MYFDPIAAPSAGTAASSRNTLVGAAAPRNRIGDQESASVRFPADAPAGSKRQRELQACVARLLESDGASTMPIEKRSHRRFPFRRPLTVTPIDNSCGRPDSLKSFPSFGIDISATGICFLARQLVPARKAVLSVEDVDGEVVHMLFEPRWVRFTRGGWYQTGGRLLEIMPRDCEPAPNLRLLESPPDIDALCENPRHPRRKPL